LTQVKQDFDLLSLAMILLQLAASQDSDPFSRGQHLEYFLDKNKTPLCSSSARSIVT
jgi:hypothetical protein